MGYLGVTAQPTTLRWPHGLTAHQPYHLLLCIITVGLTLAMRLGNQGVGSEVDVGQS